MVKSNLWSVERILKEDECKRFCTKGILHYPLMSFLLFNLCFCFFFLSFSFFFLNNLLTFVDYPTFFKFTKFVLSLFLSFLPTLYLSFCSVRTMTNLIPPFSPFISLLHLVIFPEWNIP